MPGYGTNIEREARSNDDFRRVLFTGPHSQLVLMTLKPGEDIGLESHADTDQFVRVESGRGAAVLNGQEHLLEDGSAVVIPAGTTHNIMNRAPSESLRRYTLYAPPERPDGRVNRTKAEAMEYEARHHGGAGR